MKTPRIGVVALLALGFFGTAQGADLKNRSTSASGQFVIYCDNRDLRSRLTIFVEETKERVLRLMNERDSWDYPIILTVDPVEPEKNEAGVTLSLIHNPGGGKVEMNVRIGDDPASIFLQKHVIRAVLMEMGYRNREIQPGKPLVEAPWWLVEGIIQSFRRRDGDLNADVFKSIADHSKLPPLDKFVSQPPLLLRGAGGDVDRACAMCLVEALLSLPNGPQNLARFVHEWPSVSNDPMGALAHHFPVLAESEKSLAKWWSLQIARFADSERWQGLSLEDSDKQLAEILSLRIIVDKTGRTENYAFADFEKFAKLPGAKQALIAAQIRLVGLSPRVNPLFRPIVADYEKIASLMIAGKTKGLAAKITETDSYRKKLFERMTLINDYMNWFEATQPIARTGVFDDYLRAVKERQPKPPKPVDPRITEYLDSLEKEFEPVVPTDPETAKESVAKDSR
jgi:hypothetical protein